MEINEHHKRTNRKFSREEDLKLKELVKKYGEHAWEEVSFRMNGRNVRQCKDRWMYYLSPKVSNEPWTDEEDQKLIELVKELNGKWVQIAKRFRGRNDTQIKNRWNLLRKLNHLPAISSRSHHKPVVAEKMINLEKESSEESDPIQKALFDGFVRLFSDDFSLAFNEKESPFSFF